MKAKKEKKKLNSYIKMILIMCAGGVIGACVGRGVLTWEDGLEGALQTASWWLGRYTAVILWGLAAIALIFGVVSYQKAERVIRQMDEEDDSLMEALDHRYDLWSSMGLALSSIILCLDLVILAFGFPEKGSRPEAYQFFLAVPPFLVTALICIVYQIAAVKQVRKKDPSKRGDAADLRFEKEWIESCDEAERMVIYRASYKTFTMMKGFLLFLLVIAMMGQLSFGTGMTAVVLLAIGNIAMLIVYSVYSLRFGKTKYGE